MTTPEFILPLFVLVLILTIIYRILLSKKKKSFLLLFLIYILVFFLCCLFRFFILEKIVAFLGVTTALSTLILNVSCSGSNSNVHSGGESGEISLPPAPSPRLVLLLLRIMPQAQKIQKKTISPLRHNFRPHLLPRPLPKTNPLIVLPTPSRRRAWTFSRTNCEAFGRLK